MPAASPLEIVNKALVLHLGRAPLTDFDAPDDEQSGPAAATIMRLAYPCSRDSLLVASPWNFAVRRVAPALLATPPLYGFANAYQLPQGSGENVEPLYCMRVLDTNLDPTWGYWWPWTWWVSGVWPWPATGVQGSWQVEGRTVCSDEPNLKIRYIGQVTDTSVYPAAFDDALSLDIAASAAFALTRDNNTAIRLAKQAKDALEAAIRADAKEGGQMRQVDTTLTEVR